MRAMNNFALFVLAAATFPAWADKTVAVTPADIGQVRDLEEVLVTGDRKLSSARQAIEEADERFYSRWNQTNGDPDLDVRCHRYVRTGTRLSARVCEPVFVTNMQAAAAQESIKSMQGGMSQQGGTVVLSDSNPQLMLRMQELKKRMLERVDSDPELKRALLERARLDQYYQGLRREKFRERLIVWD